MPEIYHVNNVQEAVELASKFKSEGKYDWFRGQSKDWPPYSSMYRIKQQPERIIEAEEDYDAFVKWIKQKEELKHLAEAENCHQLEAILQHYGFPTDYIDFSLEPSVAGFFAADTSNPPTDGSSCIYCLSTNELMDLWSFMKTLDDRKECKIEKIIIDVNNLWRLQAQHGVFLKANYNWDVDYPLDKIIFPYTGYPSYPTKDRIYPEHKSALEKTLDEFFDIRGSHRAIETLRPLFQTIQTMSILPNGVHLDAFKDPNTVITLPSWLDEKLKIWKTVPIEHFHNTIGFVQKLHLDNKRTAQEVRKAISYAITQLQKSNPDIRNRAIDWSIQGAPTTLDVVKATRVITQLWNGMRTLPFDAEEIGVACGNAVYLQMKDFADSALNKQLDTFKELFGDGFRVGFSNKEGNGAKGYLSQKSFDLMILPEIKKKLTDEFKHFADNPKSLFSLVYNPRLIFDFQKFKCCFATEIIPTQAAIYEQFLLFNPTDIFVFGNP